MKQYPKWFLPSLLALLTLVTLSGLGLAPTTLAIRAELDVPWRLGGGDRLWVAALHSTCAFALAAFVGALWSVHMRSGWRRRRQRVSGTMLGSSLVLLTLTAVGVYYIGDDRIAAAVAMVHLSLGLFAAPVFALHWLRGRASATAQHPHARHHVIKHRRDGR